MANFSSLILDKSFCLKALLFIFFLTLSHGCGKKTDAGKASSSEGGTTTEPAPTPASRAYMWLTASIYSGGDTVLQSDASADAECATRAAAGDPLNNLPASATNHKAVLARTGLHPRTFLNDSFDIYRSDNVTRIIANYRDFFDPAKTAENAVRPGVRRVYWTGLNPSGDLSDTCNNWTMSGWTGNRARIGDSSRTDSWRYSAFQEWCTRAPVYLLCLSY